MFDNSKVSDKQIIKPAERVEGNELVQIRKQIDEKTGASSIIFRFVGVGGAELEHREFEPSKVINGNTITDEDFKKNVGLVHSRIAHITRAYLSEETFLKIKVADSGNFRNDWNEYLKQTAQALGVQADGSVTKAKGVKTALKVVYRTTKGKHYASLPNVPTFISTENHPKQFTTNPQYDKYTIEKVTPDNETNSGGGFGGSSPTPSDPAPGFGDGGNTNHPSGF